MMLTSDLGPEPIDYWRAVTQRGVLGLGFSVRRSPAGPTLVAELTHPLGGWTRRAALAAIAVHNDAHSTRDLPLIAAHAVLTMVLEQGSAIAALKAYQDLLADAVWKAVKDDPARKIEMLGRPAPQ